MRLPPLPPRGQSVLLLVGPEIQLSWHGRTAQVVIGRDVVSPAARDAKNLSARIVENLPMPSSVAYQLRYGNFLSTGYIDIEPEFVLSSVAPLLKPGVANYRTPEDVVGYGTVYYEVEPRGDGGGKIALLATPAAALLSAVLGKFEADPEGFCKSVKPSEAACISVPSKMMIAPELRVRVNGRPACIMAGGSLGQALRAAGIKDQKRIIAEILPRLQVLRPYGGTMLPVEFDRSRGDILGLIPIGGEEIRW